MEHVVALAGNNGTRNQIAIQKNALVFDISFLPPKEKNGDNKKVTAVQKKLKSAFHPACFATILSLFVSGEKVNESWIAEDEVGEKWQVIFHNIQPKTTPGKKDAAKNPKPEPVESSATALLSFEKFSSKKEKQKFLFFLSPIDFLRLYSATKKHDYGTLDDSFGSLVVSHQPDKSLMMRVGGGPIISVNKAQKKDLARELARAMQKLTMRFSNMSIQLYNDTGKTMFVVGGQGTELSAHDMHRLLFHAEG